MKRKLYWLLNCPWRVGPSIEEGAAYLHGGEELLQVSVSASRDAERRVNITLCNLGSRTASGILVALLGRSEDGMVSGSAVTAPDMR